MKTIYSYRIGLCVMGIALSCGVAKGQTDATPATAYLQQAEKEAALYNGKIEQRYFTTAEGHPYADTKEFTEGKLRFDGITYPDVPLRLNVHRDELILLSPDRKTCLVLPAEGVEYARFGGYETRWMRPQGEKGYLAEGYYQRIRTQGNHPLYRRLKKRISERKRGMEVTQYFDEKQEYYLLQAGRFHPVGSQKALLRCLSDRQAELKTYIKRHGLRFNQERERTLVTLLDYYDTIKE